ncbi:hypothetical protein ACKAV7_015001 [Fusarium commune]
MKRTANLQERLQEKSQAVGERADAVVAPLHGGAGGESELADKAGKSQMLEDASGNNVSLMRTMLRAMLHEDVDSANGRAEEDARETLGRVMGNQRMTTQMMGEQLEMVRQLQQKFRRCTGLSNKENGKMYGSMVIYVTKASDALRLLDEDTSTIAGESASTNVLSDAKARPMLQLLGGLAIKPCLQYTQRCGNGAETGHRHRDCQAVEPKCVPCGGPHESFSQNCRLNVHKKDVVQLSMMNDRDLQDYAVLAVAEPYALNIEVADTQHALDTERPRGGTSADTVG